MEKKLAIKGHQTRGYEVIKLLEMIGGCSPLETYGLCENRFYFIGDNGWIKWNYIGPEEINEYEIFTLEEFLEKYPFKVGDKVKLYYQDEENDRYCSAIPSIIIGMRWDKTHGVVAYKMEGVDREFHKQELTYNKDENNEPNAVIAGINLNKADYADEVEINLGDYEIEVRNGRTFAVLKKPKYPTTFLACKIQIHECFGMRQAMRYKFDLLERFQKLLLCRDTYWKIAGEQMGLDGPWEPDWTTSGQDRYTIETNYNKIIFSKTKYGYKVILVFPTAEMRDAFYENFKDLIEQCKELL